MRIEHESHERLTKTTKALEKAQIFLADRPTNPFRDLARFFVAFVFPSHLAWHAQDGREGDGEREDDAEL